MENPYTEHAAVWDWDAYDRSPEYEHWCRCAERYGTKVLLPMCALGEAGAYMAQKGFAVTAFDITKEMIDEGKKRFGSIQSLSLQVADLCDLQLNESDFDFCLIATQDLHLMPDLSRVQSAFRSLAAHLRAGGCLMLELILPAPESWGSPQQTFYPRVPRYTDKQVWKESRSRYDARTRQQCIDQTIYIRMGKEVESFPYSVVLRYYEPEEIRLALQGAGFEITGEFQSRDRAPWTPQSREWIVEAVRAPSVPRT